MIHGQVKASSIFARWIHIQPAFAVKDIHRRRDLRRHTVMSS